MYSIMIWNTQHFDNQRAKLSSAYSDKKQFLDYFIQQKKPDIIALFEVGKTGSINESLVSDLMGSYTLASVLAQEGGKKKHTTLGSMVLIRDAIAKEFDDVTERYILSHTEQRAPLIIRHKASNYGFAFYHANASYMAPGNILDTIGFIESNAENLGIKQLLFFGGDLNVNAVEGPETMLGMSRLLPKGAGYTHLSVRNVTLQRATNELRLRQGYGEDTHHTPQSYLEHYMNMEAIERCEILPILLMLDYAYVHAPHAWEASCDGSVQINSDMDGNTVSISPRCLGQAIRSDHFPVLFTLKATLE
jgi:hypothetical protein